MKVALVVPTHAYTGAYPTYLALSDFPVGFAYLAAALKQAGHEVIGLNPNNDPSYPSARVMLYEKLKATLQEKQPEVVCLGGLCTDFAFIKDAIAIVRSEAPGTPIVCGGGIVTHDTEFIFTALKPDFCISGEAEEILVRLLDLLAWKDDAFDTIPNIGYWRDGAPVFTGSNFSYPPLESRPFPDYSPFDAETMLELSTHAARTLYRYTRPFPRIMPFVSARGCPYRCSFCVHQHGPKYSARPMADIMAEIGALYESYRFNILIILDELFAFDKKRLREFCDGIMEGKRTLGWDFDWLFQTHANAALGETELAMAKEAGCFFFSYGMESASPRVLASMNKKSRPEQIEKAIRLSHRAGIGFGGNYIFGDVAETPETIGETMDFFLKYGLDIHLFFMSISPYPGSQLFEHCLKQGIIKDRLTFYENIDTVMMNMTSMRDEDYFKWTREIIWPLNQMPHAMVAEPWETRQELPTKPHLAPLWQVKVDCPHCQTTNFFREPVPPETLAAGTANFLTGCTSCGKRFRVQFKENRVAGPRSGRSIPAEEIRLAIDQSLARLSANIEEIDVLLVFCDFVRWERARAWGYQVTLGLEEGLRANGKTVLTVPAFEDVSPGDPCTWLSRLREICAGKKFKQVWVELVHLKHDEIVLAHLAALAPVRVGFLGESLEYPEEIYQQYPHLRPRRSIVEKRLRYMTHVLSVDEYDVTWMNRRDGLKASWWIPTVPSRLIAEAAGPPQHRQALFSGTPYGDRLRWLGHERLQGLLAMQTPPEDEAGLSQAFNQLNHELIAALANWAPVGTELHRKYLELLRQVRDGIFSVWIKGLSAGSAVVNLPSLFQGYAGRIYEGIAAGRPVITWEIPNRPRTKALFQDGVEILMFDKDRPEQLAEHILRIQRDPDFAAQLVRNARNKLLKYHTAELQTAQVLEWIETGREPSFGEPEQRQATPQAPTNKVLPLRKAAPQAAPQVAAASVPPEHRVLVVSHYYHDSGGTETLTHNIADGLTEHGHQVDTLFLSIRPLATIADQPGHRAADRVHFLEHARLDELVSVVDAVSPDTLILLTDVFDNTLNYFTELKFRSDFRKVVYLNVNNQAFGSLDANPEFAGMRAQVLKRFDAVIAMFEESLAVYYFRHYGVPYQVIKSGIPEITPAPYSFRERFGIPQGTHILLYPGLIAPLKNQVALIDLAEQMTGDFRIVFMGNPYLPLPEYLEEFQVKLARSTRCLHLPGLSRSDVAQAMSEASLCLFPSLSEGAPLTLIEAMSHGLPWVTTPQVVFARGLEGGVVAELSEFPSQIDKLLAQPDRRARLGQQGKAFFENNFKIGQTVAAFHRLVEGLHQPQAKRPVIVIDGVFFQMNSTGIARVWKALLCEWAQSEFGKSLVVLDRIGTAPRIPGLRYRIVPAYDYHPQGWDRQMLQVVCDEEGADLFISTYYSSPLTTPTFFLAYDMIPEFTNFYDLSEPQWQEKHHAIGRASAFAAISRSTANDMARLYPELAGQVTVAYCGLDRNRFFPAASAEIQQFRERHRIDKPYFVFIGGRNGYKNGKLLLHALTRLPDRQNYLLLYVGGHPQLEPGFQAVAREAGLDVRVANLSDQDLRIAYSGAAAFVYPSMYEGFGLPILEAMACDCPVITCQNSSLPEVAGAAALYVNEDDPQELATALQQVQIPDVRQQLIKMGGRQIGKFSWEKMADVMREAITAQLARLAAGDAGNPFRQASGGAHR